MSISLPLFANGQTVVLLHGENFRGGPDRLLSVERPGVQIKARFKRICNKGYGWPMPSISERP